MELEIGKVFNDLLLFDKIAERFNGKELILVISSTIPLREREREMEALLLLETFWK